MIGIIGGSGLYDFLKDHQTIKITTPYGETSFEQGNIEGHEVVFLPRHGKGHALTPSNINYQANIYSAGKIGVQIIFATNAVGSLSSKYRPGDFVIPHDIIDVTKNRKYVAPQSDNYLRSLNTPVFHPLARSLLISALHGNNEDVHDGGVLVVTSGPRFETPAEIRAYRKMGADLVGMTSSPEAFIAAQLGIKYASLAVITNMAAGMQTNLSDQEVFDLFNNRIESVKQVLRSAVVLSKA